VLRVLAVSHQHRAVLPSCGMRSTAGFVSACPSSTIY